MTTNPQNTVSGVKPAPLPLEEIQGLIVRGYNLKYVRHIILRIVDPATTKKIIGELASENGINGLQIMSAKPWKSDIKDGNTVIVKPSFTLNISFTFAGLTKLDLPEFTAESFDTFDVFKEGAAKRAYFVGDTEESGPEYWDKAFKPDRNHIMFTMYADQKEEMELRTSNLRDLYKEACEELNALDGAGLPDGKIHFGYKDSISQPNVFGFPNRKKDGGQYAVPAWSFVLKDDDYLLDYDGNEQLPEATQPPSPIHAKGAAPYQLPKPRVLGLYGGFAAFRVLKQDVVAFEDYLQSQKDIIDPELLAAKFCGRWRSGTPLALAPEQDVPMPAKHLNNYNYLKPEPGAPNEKDDPNTVNDLLGLRCPIGSHMRRNNARNSPVSSTPILHRIIRRGVPYGPAYDPAKGDDGIERGLLGLFICASLESQFEFLMHDWMNDGDFAPDIEGTKDPLLGANDPKTSEFNIAISAEPAQSIKVKGFPRFVTTKGSAYVFFPSISALQYIGKF